jgi:transcriptional regulator GlxA family with amidase domain
VLQVGERLREEIHTRFALRAIARSVGRHPVQVSRQFHEHFGYTMSEYVRRARVARAQNLLRHASLAFSRVTSMPRGRYRLAYPT